MFVVTLLPYMREALEKSANFVHLRGVRQEVATSLAAWRDVSYCLRLKDCAASR